jgi:hypothetical protein
MRTTLYLSSFKDVNYDKGESLGLVGKALDNFSYALYEVGFEVEVNECTGDVAILTVDGRILGKAVKPTDKAKAKDKAPVTVKPVLKVITTSVARGSQSSTFETIQVINDKKIRIQIKIDSYPNQSYAHADLWTGTEWSRVHSIAYSQIKLIVKGTSYLSINPVAAGTITTTSDFRDDYEALLKTTIAIIG